MLQNAVGGSEEPSCIMTNQWPFVSEYDKNSEKNSQSPPFKQNDNTVKLGKLGTYEIIKSSKIQFPDTIYIDIDFNKNSKILQYRNQQIDSA